MKKILLLIFFPLIYISSSAQRFEWMTTLEEPGFSFTRNSKSAVDAFGNIFIITEANNPVYFGNDTAYYSGGGRFLVLAKSDPSGNPVYAKWFYMGGNTYKDIAIDSNDYVYISVESGAGLTTYTDADTSLNVSGNSGGYLISFDSNGSFRWALGGISSLGFDPWISGSLLMDGLFLAIYSDIRKYDSDGNVQWSKSANSNSVYFRGITSNAAGKIAAVARTIIDGNVTLDTVTVSSSITGNDAIVYLLDTSGSVLWGENVSGFLRSPPAEYPVALSSISEVYVQYISNFTTTPFVFAGDTLLNAALPSANIGGVIKFSSAGDPLWAKGKLYSTQSHCDPMDMIITNNDEVLVCGISYASQTYLDNLLIYSVNSGNYASYIGKLDSAGSAIWVKADSRNGFNGNDLAASLCILGNNSYIVTGAIQTGPFYQGCNLQSNSANSRVYITHVSENSDTVPVPSFSFSGSGYNYTFTDLSANATGWHWDFGNGDTSDLQNPVYTYPSGGDYTVTLTVTFGNCIESTAMQLLSVDIGEQHVNEWATISPNPFDEIIQIEFKSRGVSVDEIVVTDIVGRVLLRESSIGGSLRKTLNTSSLIAGTYFVFLRNENTARALKMIKADGNE